MAIRYLNSPNLLMEPAATRPAAPDGDGESPKPATARFHGSVILDSADTNLIAEAVIHHRAELMGANVSDALEIEADIPTGTLDNVVGTVTGNPKR